VHYDVTNARKLAEARHELDWDEQFLLALYGEHGRKIHERDGETETSTVCGDLCAVKMVKELFGTAGYGKEIIIKMST